MKPSFSVKLDRRGTMLEIRAFKYSRTNFTGRKEKRLGEERGSHKNNKETVL